MAYRSCYGRYRRRGGYRKRRYYKPKAASTGTSWWYKGAQAAAYGAGKLGINYLKKRLGLNTENKNYDQTWSQNFTGTATSLLLPTNGIAQGNTNNTRSGNSLRITHMNLKGRIQSNILDNNQVRCRIIGVLQKSVPIAGTTLTGSQVLETASSIASPYNTDLQDCKVIFDRTWTLRPVIAGSSVQILWRYKWSPSYDEGHVTWTDADTTGLTANQLKGIVRFYIYCDASANYPSTAGYCRVYFVDN